MLSTGASPVIFRTGCATRSATLPLPQPRYVGHAFKRSPNDWLAVGAVTALLGRSVQRKYGRMCQSSKMADTSVQSKVLAVVGLGNVGSQYMGTRHNIGFAAVDEVASRLMDGSGKWILQEPIWEDAHGGNILRLKRRSPTESAFTELVLFKPASMMNGSGLPVSQLMGALKLPETHLVVIYDDLDLEVGRLRVRKSGSAGGQNGVRSVLAHGFKHFLRMRLGISRPPKDAGRNGVVGHVLCRFRHEELDKTGEALQMTAEAIEDLAEGMSVDNVMNKFNKSLVTAA